MPVASPTAPASGDRASAPGGSSTTTVIPARRASAASRPSRSMNARPVPTPDRPAPAPDRPPSRLGRSMTSRSTARPASSEPAIDRPSSGSAGVTTTSHSGLIPRATTSTGSSAAARSSQATIAPSAWAAAASRRARVVRPLEASPRSATPMPLGTPPGPRMASRSGKPVEKTRSGACCGSASDSSGTVARAPTTSPAYPGAAAPQRVRRVASAVCRSEVGALIVRPVSNKCSNESRPSPIRPSVHPTLTRLRVTRRRKPAARSMTTPRRAFSLRLLG